jgi:hypothetical protein
MISPRGFIVGMIVFFAALPLLFFVSVFAPMAAFSPNAHPPHLEYWKEKSAIDYTWFVGGTFTTWVLDYAIFGSPMPPAPTNPDFSDPDVDRKLEEMNRVYLPEKKRRAFVHSIAWLANPLFFGLIFGLLFRILSKPKTTNET